MLATPFDEASIDRCVSYDVDHIKIASCSITDWPLIESVARTDKPVIFSTAGANLDQIDAMVSFFQKIECSSNSDALCGALSNQR